jgi:hypothetical protein
MEQDAATHRRRKESVQTQLEVSKLRKEMQSMMQQMMAAFTTTLAGQDIKRSNDNNKDDSTPSEKRLDVRTTPGKRLFFDEMDRRDCQCTWPQWKRTGQKISKKMSEDSTNDSDPSR